MAALSWNKGGVTDGKAGAPFFIFTLPCVYSLKSFFDFLDEALY